MRRLLVLPAVLVAAFLLSVPLPPSHPARLELASAELTDDDGSVALFASVDLRPGVTVTRCLTVTYAGAGVEGPVVLSARDAWGSLLPYLALTVRIGTGGGFADCAGFSGDVVYEGGIQGLDVDTGWAPGDGDSRTFELSVTVADDNAAQGRSAGTTLRWDLLVGDPKPESPFPSASAAPDPSVAASAPVASAPVASGPVASEPVARQPGLKVERTAWDTVWAVAGGVVRHAVYPLAGLLAMLLFLLVQHRIDRGDPKLAAAPLVRREHLEFDPDRPDQPVDDREEG